MNDNRITRITEMEARLNRISAWLKHPCGDVREDARLLDEYYRSPQWRSDFEADEAGELPAELPRGVLSEDAVYNALTAYDRLANYTPYDGRIVRVTDSDGRAFIGVAEALSADYCFHEYGRDEAGIELCGVTFFASDISAIEALPRMSILRATETWQQAGAYYVRIQAMAKKHHIALRQEFDEHDSPNTKYIVVTDDDFPIATARMYPLDDDRVMIGRVVVLPEYRRQGIGRMVVHACEAWAEELFYSKAVVESRENKVAFYRQMDYEIAGEPVDGGTFRVVRMEKLL